MASPSPTLRHVHKASQEWTNELAQNSILPVRAKMGISPMIFMWKPCPQFRGKFLRIL